MSKIYGDINREMIRNNNKGKQMDTDELLDIAGRCGATTLRKHGLGVIQFYTHELHKFADFLLSKNELMESALIKKDDRLKDEI